MHAFRRFAAMLILVALGPATVAETAPILQTIPANGDISGSPGVTIGWGYSITNDDPVNWLVTSGVGADPFLSGTPDGSVFDFPIVAPGATVILPFDSTLAFGLYSFTWDLGTPVGAVNTGTFVVSAEWWDGEPGTGGNFVDFAADLTAPYSVTAAVAPVPEPASVGLLLLGAVARWARRRRQRTYGTEEPTAHAIARCDESAAVC
jgi:hypothetical protein